MMIYEVKDEFVRAIVLWEIQEIEFPYFVSVTVHHKKKAKKNVKKTQVLKLVHK